MSWNRCSFWAYWYVFSSEEDFIREVAFGFIIWGGWAQIREGGIYEENGLSEEIGDEWNNKSLGLGYGVTLEYEFVVVDGIAIDGGWLGDEGEWE